MRVTGVNRRSGSRLRPPRRPAASALGRLGLAVGGLGHGLQLAQQAGRRGVGQGDDALGGAQGQGGHAGDQRLAAGELGDVLDLVRADDHPVDGPPLDLGLLELLDLGRRSPWPARRRPSPPQTATEGPSRNCDEAPHPHVGEDPPGQRVLQRPQPDRLLAQVAAGSWCSATASSPLRSRIRTERLPSRSDRSWSIIISLTYLLMIRVRALRLGRVDQATTRMPGLMVAEMVTERMYVPLAAAGLTVRRWFRNVLMFSSSWSSVKFSLPTGGGDVAPLVVAELDLARLELADRRGDVGRDGPRAGRRHQPARAEQPAERADDAHHVGRGQGDVEVQEPPLDPGGQVVAPDDVGAGGRRLLGVLALGEDGHPHALADPVGQGDRAADVLVALAGVDPEVGRDLDRLVELRRAERLQLPDRIGQRHRVGRSTFLIRAR